MRTWDAIKIGEALAYLLKSHDTLDPIEWLSDQRNIALENGEDLALFEWGLNGRPVYSGHYYFKSRGAQAIKSAKQILDALFNTCYNIGILMGLVPIRHKAARWMSRQVGFTSYGTDEIHGTEYELFIITKKEFNHE